MRKFLSSAILLLGLVQGVHAGETIFDLYAAIGDTVFFPIVDTRDGRTVTNAAGVPLKMRIDEKGRFLAYLEEGGGWAVNTFKFWPLPDGGAIAATMVGTFEADVMFADSYAEFYARRPGGSWEVVDPPMEQLDVSYFLDQAPVFRREEQKKLFEETTWGLFYELRPDREHVLVHLTATNRDKCWPEAVFEVTGQSDRDDAGGPDFCRDVYDLLMKEVVLRLDEDNGRFEIVPLHRKLMLPNTRRCDLSRALDCSLAD
ncbi:MAG: hypothetical protein AB7E24_05360 [Novosphingobium sp.]